MKRRPQSLQTKLRQARQELKRLRLELSGTASPVHPRRTKALSATSEIQRQARRIRIGARAMTPNTTPRFEKLNASFADLNRELTFRSYAWHRKQSPEQKAFQAEVEAVGMRYAVIRNLEDLEAIIG